MSDQHHQPKTFADFGLNFIPNEDCITCNTGSCHNNVTSRKNGREYNVYITVDYDEQEYFISATENSTAESNLDIFERFNSEEDAVRFVCDRFDWFNCF